jgi:hypothetical protein
MKTLKVTRLAIGLALFGGVTWSGAARADRKEDAAPAVADLKACDTKGDGKLSPEEHAACAKQTFDATDTNGDGKVTTAETKAARDRTSGKETSMAPMTADEIKALDGDGDGVVTEVERASAVRMMFEALDTNKDGFISQSEVVAGYAKRMRGR